MKLSSRYLHLYLLNACGRYHAVAIGPDVPGRYCRNRPGQHRRSRAEAENEICSRPLLFIPRRYRSLKSCPS
jgi:hypothetical protein